MGRVSRSQSRRWLWLLHPTITSRSTAIGIPLLIASSVNSSMCASPTKRSRSSTRARGSRATPVRPTGAATPRFADHMPSAQHPTHQRLITLGLIGMAKALEEQRRPPDLDALPFEERLGTSCRSRSRRTRHQTLSIAKPPNETPNGSRRASSSQPCAKAHAWKTSICARRAASTALSSPGSSSAIGSIAMRTYSSRGQPGSARVGLPAPSATKLAATIVRFNIIASLASSRHSLVRH